MANNLTKIVAGLLIGIAVLLGIYAWILGRKSAPTVPSAQQAVAAKMFPVVVAAHMLPAGEPITADELKLQRTGAMLAGGFTDPAQLVGRIPINNIPVQAPVLERSLSSGLADLIAPGERAVAIKVDESNAVGNRIRPGNFVDVFLNLKREGGMGLAGAEVANSQARLLLSKIRVLSFGDATSERDSSAGSMSGVRTAVLAVPTQQVDALTLAEASGQLMLALRSPLDEDVAAQTVAVRAGSKGDPSALAAAGIYLSDLSGSDESRKSVAKPLRPVRVRPAAGGSIEVIRGGRAETVAY